MRALALCLIAFAALHQVARAQVDYDEEPDVMVSSAKSIRLQWEKRSSGCSSVVYKVYQRVGGSVSAAQTQANDFSVNAWTSVYTSSANELTTELTGLLGCGTMYEFRISANCDSAGEGDMGPPSDPVFTPQCHSGATFEQCGVRANGAYSCNAASAVTSIAGLTEIASQTIATSGDGTLVKSFFNLNFASITTSMWTEPGFANAFDKALGETLEDITTSTWVNASTYIGDIYLCSDSSYGTSQGCGLGSSDTGVSIEAVVDCGNNADCITATQGAMTVFGQTDPTTSQTYALDFVNRLLYYMVEDTYDFQHQPSDTTYTTSYSTYNTLAVSDVTYSFPTTYTSCSDCAVNPLTSTWMPSIDNSAAATHPKFRDFNFPCGIHRQGTVGCFGYYNQWANGSHKVPREVAPLYRQRKYKMISSDGLRTCGITIEDQLTCWGYTDFGSYTSGSLVFPCGWTKQILAKRDEYELEYNENDSAESTWARVKLQWRWNWVSVGGGSISGSTYGGVVCAVRQDGKGFCFGCNEALGVTGNLQDEMPDDIDEWQKIEVAPDGTWACGWAEDGQARCWGVKGGHPEIPEDTYARDVPSIVASSQKVACILRSSDSKLLCYGHYVDTSNKQHEISRIFSNGDTFATDAALADTSTSGWAGNDCFRVFTRGGCGDVFTGGVNSAQCVKEWDSASTGQYCTSIGPGSLTSGSTEFAFIQAPAVAYGLTSGVYDDDPVAVANADGYSATITFVPPTVSTADSQEAIAGYQVYVKGGARRRRRRGGKYKMKWMVANTDTAQTSLTIKGLLPEEKYKFKLRAFSSASGYTFGRMSDSTNTIYTPVAVPRVITSFWWNASESADDYVMLNWKNPEGSGLEYDVTHYSVRHSLTSGSAYTTSLIYPRTNVDMHEDEYVQEWFNGLTPGTTYYFGVAACNDQGCQSTYTADITVTTNYTLIETEYVCSSNITFVAQWCYERVDCGSWITTNTWDSVINDNFILAIIYWLQWHSTYNIEYIYSYEAYTAVPPTPAPSLGTVGDVTTTVPGLTVTDQEDWDTTTTTGCAGGASTGCYQPTAQPTQIMVEQVSSDGYYNDIGALNGSATGERTLTANNVSLGSETDVDVVIQNSTGGGTTSGVTEATYTGTNVPYDVTTGTEEQANTVLQIVTQNDPVEEESPDTVSFSTAFTTTANESYSAYTGTTTTDNTQGASESKSTSDDNTGIWIALLAAVVVCICLIIFILHGWYKRRQLKKYLERRSVVTERFKKAAATIGQMRRLGNLTEILKANENAFSYQNLKEAHKDAARNLLDVYDKAQTDSGAGLTPASAYDEEAEIQRLKDEYMKSREYQDASAARKRKLLEERITQRKAELRARRQGTAVQDEAVRERVEGIIAAAAVDNDFKIMRLDNSDEEELARLKKEVEDSILYQNASEFEKREMMKKKLEERRKKLLDAKQAEVREGEKVLDNEVVDTIIERASASLMQQLQAEAFDEEAELARLKAEYERSDEYLNAQKFDQKAMMKAKLDARKVAIRARQAEKRANTEQAPTEDGMTPQMVELATIVSKVEANVADACDAKAEAAAILQQFQEAEADGEKHSAEARQAKKEALQARLRARRAEKARILEDMNAQLSEAEKEEARAELVDLPEKWQEVEDDLVEQALCTYEMELEQQSETSIIDDRAQEAALAKVMWQLDRDMAHAEELRNNEWASSEAANILKRYDQAAKRHESDIKTAQEEHKNALRKRLEKRRMLRVKKTANTMWEKIRMAKPHETTTVAMVIQELERGYMDV